jgi:hypothetical protein
MTRRVTACLAAVIFLTVGCDGVTTPFSAVVVRVEAEPVTASVGDGILLRAIATNLGEQSETFMAGCGEGLDFEVELPSGERRLLLRGLLTPCEMNDSNVIEPAETDTVTFGWTVPASGTYRIWAGTRIAQGIASRSAPVQVVGQ